ncbi:hypothetical protein C8J57DRAFT_1231134 [Mycena rebaudengoi]|nr:hypothetical protein C8J57DRAFT_1231134 [Mycena rebaudengoi]
MPPTTGVDLKQVGKLFNDTISALRDDAPGIEALEPEAIEWLKGARYKVMRRLEAAYYELESSRDNPLLRPDWIDPAQKLYVFTDNIPIVLRPYTEAFRRNLLGLMHDCDFTSCTVHPGGFGTNITILISFPARLSATAHSGPAATRALLVEDEFSSMPEGDPHGNFSATRFARLLGDMRGEEDHLPCGHVEGSGPVAAAESTSEEDETDEATSVGEDETHSDDQETNSSAFEAKTSTRRRSVPDVRVSAPVRSHVFATQRRVWGRDPLAIVCVVISVVTILNTGMILLLLYRGGVCQ